MLDIILSFLKTRNWKHKLIHISIGLLTGIIAGLIKSPLLGVIIITIAILIHEYNDHVIGNETITSNIFDIIITILPAFVGFLF